MILGQGLDHGLMVVRFKTIIGENTTTETPRFNKQASQLKQQQQELLTGPLPHIREAAQVIAAEQQVLLLRHLQYWQHFREPGR